MTPTREKVKRVCCKLLFFPSVGKSNDEEGALSLLDVERKVVSCKNGENIHSDIANI